MGLTWSHVAGMMSSAKDGKQVNTSVNIKYLLLLLTTAEGATAPSYYYHLLQLEVYEFILRNGGDKHVNMYIPLGITPLLAAAVNNSETDMAVVRAMVKHGEDVNAVDKVSGALKMVVKVSAALGVKPMIGIKRLLVTMDIKGTPLHHAAKMGNVEMCRTLVELGAKTDTQDVFGRSPLEVARAQNPGSEGNVLDTQLAGILGQ